MRVLLAAVTLLIPATAAAEVRESESVSVATAIGMAAFIALAVLICLSVVGKLAIFFGLVPRDARTGRDRTLHFLANVVGSISLTPQSRIRRRGGRTSAGSGRSFGGGGASGRY
jgi:uncharacterized membrane protein YgcG